MSKKRIAQLEGALEKALRIAQRHICRHDELTRGGAIWTICKQCNARWADDRGGFKEDPDLEALERLNEVLP